MCHRQVPSDGASGRIDRLLAQRVGDPSTHPLQGLRLRREQRDELHQLHDRCGVEEVDAHDVACSTGHGTELDDRDRRRVGRQDRVVLGQDLPKPAKQFDLGDLVLGRGFDDEITVGKGLQVGLGRLNFAPGLGAEERPRTRSSTLFALSSLISVNTTLSPARAATCTWGSATHEPHLAVRVT